MGLRIETIYLLLFLTMFEPLASGQATINVRTREINTGKELEVSVLSPSIKEALRKEGYKVITTEEDKALFVQILASTRQGSESQGIYTSFADISVVIKNNDGLTLDEKSLIGLKGAGLSYEHAGIDAITKSQMKVIPELLQMLKNHKNIFEEAEVEGAQFHLVSERPETRPSELYKDEITNIRKTESTNLAQKNTGMGRFYALLIGINDYKDPGITNLDNPVKDAETLYATLTGYYTFYPEDVLFLKNPTRSQIIIAFDEISRKITIDDNLLIFYAGHGLYDPKKNLGYWLPADANISNTANWVYNSTIQDIIQGIHSKHTLLVSDACFSGSIFKTRGLKGAPPSIEMLYNLQSRRAMTSGMMTEVPDKSLFIEYLNRRLKENSQPYLSSYQLFASFSEAVMNNSPNTPQYGIIQNTGDEGGDFIFVRKFK